MTYFGFLALFLGIPIAVLAVLTWWDHRTQRSFPPAFKTIPWALALAVHILIALVYTTPWDNYLVATNVWWYDPHLVTGIVIGYVPIEEYTFFLVQPIFTGLWLVFWLRRLPVPATPTWDNGRLRRNLVIISGILWSIMVGILIVGWKPGTYLALELGWALVPMALQFAFGADILRRYWRQVAVGIIPTTLYLAFADALAIQSGTWTIDPAQSLNIYLGGVLPIEEFIFFLITNVMLVLGMTLVLARESQDRLHQLEQQFPWMQRWLRRVRQVSTEA